MNNSINIVASTSYSLQINDKEVSKKARKREYNKKRYQLNKTKIQEYSQRPEVKARKQKYNQRPETKAKRQEYNQRPDVKAKRREINRKWYQANKEIKLKYNEIKSQNESIKRKEQNKVINEIDNEQMIDNSLTNLEVDQVNSECLQFSNDIYDQQTITRALNALEPEQIIWLNQSLDQLLNCKSDQSKIINNKFS